MAKLTRTQRLACAAVRNGLVTYSKARPVRPSANRPVPVDPRDLAIRISPDDIELATINSLVRRKVVHMDPLSRTHGRILMSQ
jgi:hypothetical protein